MQTLLRIAHLVLWIALLVIAILLLISGNGFLIIAIPVGGALTALLIGGPLVYANNTFTHGRKDTFGKVIKMVVIACSLNTMLSTAYYNTVALVADKELSQTWNAFVKGDVGFAKCEYDHEYFAECEGGILAQRDRILAERHVLSLIRWEEHGSFGDEHYSSGLAFKYWF